MKAYLVDVQNDRRGPIETDGSLESLYELIGCRCIDIVTRTVRGVAVNVVCDDEGLLVERPIVSAMTSGLNPALCGNLVLFGIGADMDLCSLTDDEVLAIDLNVAEHVNLQRGTTQPVLFIDQN